jgi:predicted site-specific integrase-resolvase
MKLSKYAKELGIDYRTAWNWFKAGKIDGAYQTSTGTVIVPDVRDEQNEEYIKTKRVKKEWNGTCFGHIWKYAEGEQMTLEGVET